MIALAWKLAQLEAVDLRLLGHALLTLARVRILLWTRPWQRLCSSLERPVRAVAVRPDVRRLAWAIHAASRYVPRATCLTRALALQRLLSDFGYEAIVQVGIQHSHGTFTAHAWTEHAGHPLLDAPADLVHYRRLFIAAQSRPNLP